MKKLIIPTMLTAPFFANAAYLECNIDGPGIDPLQSGYCEAKLEYYDSQNTSSFFATFNVKGLPRFESLIWELSSQECAKDRRLCRVPISKGEEISARATVLYHDGTYEKFHVTAYFNRL